VGLLDIFFQDKEEKEEKKPQVGVVVSSLGNEVEAAQKEIQDNPNDFFGEQTEGNIVDQVNYMSGLDPLLTGFIDTRINAILSNKREIIGEGEPAKFVRENFSKIRRFDNKLRQLLKCISVGYSVPELIWSVENNKWWVTFEPRHQGKFWFNDFGETFLVSDKNPQGKKVTDIKFPVLTFNEEYGNKYGKGLYQNIYWYWFIKKNAATFWAVFTERFASPLVVAKKDGEIKKEVQDKIDGFIADIRNATSISIPESIAIEFLELKEARSTENFVAFMDFLNKSIAIAILGQVDTSGVAQSSASYARAIIQNQVRQDIMLSDIIMLENFINDMIIRPLVDFNFSNVTDYPKWRVVINSIIDADTIKKLVESGHNRIPIKFISERFGIPIPDDLKKDEYLEIKATGQPTFSEQIFSETKNMYMKELKGIMK
jgi:phage gp29-like protein